MTLLAFSVLIDTLSPVGQFILSEGVTASLHLEIHVLFSMRCSQTSISSAVLFEKK